MTCAPLADGSRHDPHEDCPGWPDPTTRPTPEQYLARLIAEPREDGVKHIGGLLDAAEFGNRAWMCNWEQQAETMSAIQRDVTLISTWVDTSYPEHIHHGTELHMRRRVDKIAEEHGEVVEAMAGMWAENPRKGKTNDIDKVEYELLDVACAALGALFSITGGTHLPYRLAEHLDTVARRMRAHQEEQDHGLDEAAPSAPGDEGRDDQHG